MDAPKIFLCFSAQQSQNHKWELQVFSWNCSINVTGCKKQFLLLAQPNKAIFKTFVAITKLWRILQCFGFFKTFSSFQSFYLCLNLWYIQWHCHMGLKSLTQCFWYFTWSIHRNTWVHIPKNTTSAPGLDSNYHLSIPVISDFRRKKWENHFIGEWPPKRIFLEKTTCRRRFLPISMPGELLMPQENTSLLFSFLAFDFKTWRHVPFLRTVSCVQNSLTERERERGKCNAQFISIGINSNRMALRN